ncbi:MAG TPA: lytic transglycosylase domain-containing protein [Thermoanaerobaculia bacterium]|nr:lytic transglycosylase domain-containing protein [Thermoanaerobaculia bacterium]
MKRILLAAVVLFAALPASASIALFTDGRSMKVTGYRLVDESSIQLTFGNGGAMTVPLSRVDRIVDDEVVAADKAPEVKAELEKGVFPRRPWGYDSRRGPIIRSKYDQMIVDAAKKFDVDAALVSAVIKAESDFNPREISNKGARGLMQLMPATAERFGVSDSFDPEANIDGGVRYLRWLLDTFHGNADKAVAAYNAGEGNVWKYNGVPPFRETITYLKRVAHALLAVVHTTAGSASAGVVASAERN